MKVRFGSHFHVHDITGIIVHGGCTNECTRIIQLNNNMESRRSYLQIVYITSTLEGDATSSKFKYLPGIGEGIVPVLELCPSWKLSVQDRLDKLKLKGKSWVTLIVQYTASTLY